MRVINQVRAKVLVGILSSLFIVSCASIPELKVLYQLPPKSDQLKGMSVSLLVEDARKNKEILKQGAKQEFGNFVGNISLSVARHNESGFKIGLFEFAALVKEGFKRRLRNEGLKVIATRSPGEPQLLIVINDFILDLVGRKWKAKMGYEAKLIRDGQTLATQIIEGQGERHKLIGRKEADTVTGEIFTDMVNRLDVVRLFRQAGLIE
jgi:hypothetical protein